MALNDPKVVYILVDDTVIPAQSQSAQKETEGSRTFLGCVARHQETEAEVGMRTIQTHLNIANFGNRASSTGHSIRRASRR